MSNYNSKGHSHRGAFYLFITELSHTIPEFCLDFLWVALHRGTPLASYHAAETFSSAAIELIDALLLPSCWEILIWPVARSHIPRVLCTADTILDSEQHLTDTCYGLIGDILREIDSDGAVSRASLRSRCKTASLTIKRETQMLESVMKKLENDLNPKRMRRFYNCLFYFSAVLCLLVGLPTFIFIVSPKLVTRGLSFTYLMAFLAYWAQDAYFYVYKVSRPLKRLHIETLTLIWAWRDMRGLLTLISKSESLQLFDISHAKTFLEAFQWSFMGGHVELWKTRSKIQSLSGFADKIQTMKDQDALTRHRRRRRTGCPWHRRSARSALRLGRTTLASFYSKVSSLISGHKGKKRRYAGGGSKRRKTGNKNEK
ncbi:uncharacterized protein EV420DRAFT_437141 [Desarmillaria tabescens]|uniref:Uncharacterized protein n=1 Tax=Armillaria tabescens TaxID=1929756 RepID=A0AA39NLQ0_ARMTA|nr:uncharacterized protein EV420DRAFT_437141 [Desarmillaria tabescens]KAK0467958.1 hypothetical protein EV420DRAFT_437141 [Desarmillaria tabescens]